MSAKLAPVELRDLPGDAAAFRLGIRCSVLGCGTCGRPGHCLQAIGRAHSRPEALALVWSTENNVRRLGDQETGLGQTGCFARIRSAWKDRVSGAALHS